jgi:hypothetical protein
MNMATLRSSGLTFRETNNGETILFREKSKPMVDFFPSTGRWRIVGRHPKTFRGGARAFLPWYKKQGATPMSTKKPGTQEETAHTENVPDGTQQDQGQPPVQTDQTAERKPDRLEERPWHERTDATTKE